MLLLHSGTHSKVGHIREEDIHLDDLLDRRACLGQDGLQVADAGGSLLLDGAGHEIALRVAGDLP